MVLDLGRPKAMSLLTPVRFVLCLDPHKRFWSADISRCGRFDLASGLVATYICPVLKHEQHNTLEDDRNRGGAVSRDPVTLPEV